MRVFADVDLVLAKGGKPYKDCIPYEFALEYLWRLKKAGFTLTLFTSRYMEEENANITRVYERGYLELVEWCQKYQVPYDHIILGKPSYDIFLDDKAFRVESEKGREDWEKLFEHLRNANLSV